MNYKKSIFFLIINLSILTKLIFNYYNLNSQVAGLAEESKQKPKTNLSKSQIKLPPKSNIDEFIKILTSLAQMHTTTMKVDMIEYKDDNKVIISITTPNLECISDYISHFQDLIKQYCSISEVVLADQAKNDDGTPVYNTGPKKPQVKTLNIVPFSMSYITQQKKQSNLKNPNELSDAKRAAELKEQQKYKLSITVNI